MDSNLISSDWKETIFRIGFWLFSGLCTVLFFIARWLWVQLTKRLAECVTHTELTEIIRHQTETESLRAVLREQMHQQNLAGITRIEASIAKSFEDLKAAIGAETEGRHKLAGTVQVLSNNVAALAALAGIHKPS